MILEDVKFHYSEQGDNRDGSPFNYHSRNMTITTDKGTFETPMRVTTRTEYVARSRVPLSRTVPLDLAIDFRELDRNQVIGFMKNDKVARKMLYLAKQFNALSTRANFRISVIQPPENLLQIMTNTEKTKFADMQAEYLQENLREQLITYPYLGLPISEYKQFIDKRYLRTHDLSTIFTLYMGMKTDDLREILDHLIAKQQPMIILMIHKEWGNSIPQHDLLKTYLNNEKVAFFATQVEREEDESHTSNLHSVAFGGGFDLVSLKQVRGYNTRKKLDLNKIKFFNPINLRIDNIANTINDDGRNLIKELDIPSDNFNDLVYVDRMILGYKGAKVHPKKYDKLYYLARTHEAIVSPTVFNYARPLIERQELIDHLKQTNLKEVPMIRRRRTA